MGDGVTKAGSDTKVLLAGALLFAFLGAGCGGGGDGVNAGAAGAASATITSTAPRDLVLVTIDTLRADRCSSYGHTRATTPTLDALAARGVLFENAYASSSWTAPSMASLFTGLPARAHGVVSGAIQHGGVYGQEYLDDSFATLAAELTKHGYQCLGLSSNTHVGVRTGFARGFEEFREHFWEDAARVNDGARALAALRDPSRPAFYWVHYIDPHVPYEAREPWTERFVVDATAREHWAGASHGELIKALRGKANDPSAREALLGLYDAEVAYVDDAMGQLLETLELADDTLIAVTSDHGESLLEHRAFGHGSSLYEQQVRVPLLIAGGGLPRGTRVPTPVGNEDLMPTLLELLGLPRPAAVEGRSLASLALGEGGVTGRPVFMELSRAAHDVFAVRHGDWKLTRRFEPVAKVTLHHLGEDPGETINRVVDSDAALRSLTGAWRAWDGAWPRYEAGQVVMGDVDGEEAERLRSLGYLGH